MTARRLAILGAGPIGIEATLLALDLGWDVDLYEKNEPGANVARWGHVRLFSPWGMNRSKWGEMALRANGHELADEDQFPTGREYLDRYLLPLARLEKLQQCLHERTRVVGVSRERAFKGDYIGDDARAEGPFLILLEGPNGERYERANVVIDTTGVYDQPRRLGPGGLAALGEREAEQLIERYVPDVVGKDRPSYVSQATLLVGNGYSAVTSAKMLAELHRQEPDTQVYWLLVDDQPPYPPIPDDPLPQRLELAKFGNRAAQGRVEGIEPIFGQLHSFRRHGEGLEAEIRLVEGRRALHVDRVIGNVGYKPDVELYRELQIHQCYATEGIMKLAAHLLAQQGGGGDCLQQSSGGLDTLMSPEPDFYVLGSKSYGRNSDFLLRVGFEQLDELFEEIGNGK